MISWEWVIVGIAALLLFGGKRLPQLAKDLGAGIKAFRKALTDQDDDVQKPVTPQAVSSYDAYPPSQPRSLVSPEEAVEIEEEIEEEEPKKTKGTKKTTSSKGRKKSSSKGSKSSKKKTSTSKGKKQSSGSKSKKTTKKSSSKKKE